MPGLGGLLTDMNLVNLIQVITVSNKTGALGLAEGGLKATLFVHHGQVVNAMIADAASNRVLLDGEEAFYAVARWRHGRFWFTQKAASAPDYYRAIAAGNDHLIMEALRRIDEETRVAAIVGPDCWVGLDATGPRNGQDAVQISRDAWRLLVLVCRGIGSVGDLAAQSAFGERRTLATVAELVEGGLLQLVPPPAGAPGAPPLAESGPPTRPLAPLPAGWEHQAPANPPAGMPGRTARRGLLALLTGALRT